MYTKSFKETFRIKYIRSQQDLLLYLYEIQVIVFLEQTLIELINSMSYNTVNIFGGKKVPPNYFQQVGIPYVYLFGLPLQNKSKKHACEAKYCSPCKC